MKSVYSLTIFLAFMFAASAHATWMHRILRDNDPVRIELLKTFLRLNPSHAHKLDAEGNSLQDVAHQTHNLDVIQFLNKYQFEFEDTVAQPKQNAIGIPLRSLPREVWAEIISRIDSPTIQDIASLRRVNRDFCDTANRLMAGRLRFFIGDMSALVKLIILSGSPLLKSIGSIDIGYSGREFSGIFPSRFHFRLNSDQIHQAMGDILVDFSLKQCGAHQLNARSLLIHWPAFLADNAQRLKNVHQVTIHDSSHWEYFITHELRALNLDSKG